MYRAIQKQGLKSFLSQEAPFALIALFIAELFYKFHSFLFECIAFLATWYALSYVANQATKWLSKNRVQE